MTLDAKEKSRYQANPIECYRIKGSTIWRFTSADLRVWLDVAGDGLQVYQPEIIGRGEPSFSQEQSSGQIEVTLPAWNVVAQLFIPFTPPAPIEISIYRLHGDDGGVATIFLGKIIGAKFDGPEATLICAPFSAELKRQIPRIACQATCNWATYSPGCGLNRNDFKDVGTISSISGYDVRAAIFATRADGWFNAGYLELADGTSRYITSHVGDRVTLQSPIVGLIVGAAISAFAGDDRTEATCASKFNNLANHLGFKRMPTRNPYQLGMS